MLTPEDADARSRERAKVSRRRVWVLAVFVVSALLLLSFNLQRSQSDLRTYVVDLCNVRADAVKQTNANWEALAAIERDNEFVDESLRMKRLMVYNNAKVRVPYCGGDR